MAIVLMWFSTNLEYFFNAKKIDFLIFFIFEKHVFVFSLV